MTLTWSVSGSILESGVALKKVSPRLKIGVSVVTVVMSLTFYHGCVTWANQIAQN